MRMLRSGRWLLLAFVVFLLPSVSHAGVFISVGFAPPPLVVYDQPPCPQPGLMWTPGYWAYGPDGYYWVPGAWVPAPYEGAYWTPGYWGWNAGLYMWHPGYWGRHVGYYGGINYGFGFFGVGFVGGAWRGNVFAYNTAVVHVNTVVVRNVYVDRTVIRQHTIVENHVAFNGGPGGIRHDPTPDERSAMRGPHMEATSFQQQHMQQAMQNRSAYFHNNHGRPAEMVSRQPLPAERHTPPAMRNGGMENAARPNAMPYRGSENNMRQGQPPSRPMVQQPQPQSRQQYDRQIPQRRPEARPQNHPQGRYQERPQGRNEGHSRPQDDHRR